MHRGSLIAAFLLMAPCATAQVPYYGTLGIYDDPEHTQPFGSMLPGFKTIYIGVDLDSPPWATDLLGLEFSVAGLDPFFLLGMDVQPATPYAIGDIHAPVDSSTGTGGINIGWDWLIPDSSVSIALHLVGGAPPADHVLRVLRRFPPTSLEHPFPLAYFDSGLVFIRMPLIGRSYTLNPTIAVESGTWSAVKSLFRGS